MSPFAIGQEIVIYDCQLPCCIHRDGDLPTSHTLTSGRYVITRLGFHALCIAPLFGRGDWWASVSEYYLNAVAGCNEEVTTQALASMELHPYALRD